MTNQTQITKPADVTPESPASQQFLEAILYKDVVTLRTFGVDDKVTASIDLKTQIDVAQKLLASENAIRRAQSKRILAAQAGVLPIKAATVTNPPAPKEKPFFQTFAGASSKYNPANQIAV